MGVEEFLRYLIQIERKPEAQRRASQKAPPWDIAAIWELPKMIDGVQMGQTFPAHWADSVWSGSVSRWDGKSVWGRSDAVLHLPLDETDPSNNRTYRDYSGHELLGTISGAGPIRASGKVGYGVANNGGAGYLDMGADANYNIIGSMTMMAWTKLNVVPGSMTPSRDYIMEKTGGGDNDGPRFFFQKSSASLRFEVVKFGTVHAVGSTKSDWAANVWYHIAGRYGAGTLALLIDGVLDGTVVDAFGAVPTNTYPCTIARAFEGTVDDPRWYDKAVRDTEIKYIAEHPI